MLGSIPSLEIMFCQQVVDISSLNHNQKVKIEFCDQIRDYSQSFRNTRNITLITVTNHEVFHFDLLHWKRAEKLSPLGSTRNVINFTNGHNHIPHSVKRCALRGTFVTAVDFTVTADHVLQEIKLAENDTITSLEGYGLERLTVIECDRMKALTSLQGLGQGRCQKITISECNQITDFSPIGHLPVVIINDCRGFTDPRQVRFVRDLITRPIKSINFQSDPNVNPLPYAKVQSLSVVNTNICLERLDGLETIPILTLHYPCLKLIIDFLKGGKQLQNEKIIIEDFFTHANPAELFAAHQRYLEEQHYYPPKKCSYTWLWIRKKL